LVGLFFSKFFKIYKVKIKIFSCSEETPRPESYREDYSLAENLDIEDRGELFKELRLDFLPRERSIVK